MSPHENHWEVGTDIGGTFTDIIAIRRSPAEARIAKVPSRPHAPVPAMLAAIEAVGLQQERGQALRPWHDARDQRHCEDRLPKWRWSRLQDSRTCWRSARYRRRDLYRLDMPPKSPPLVPPERCFGLAERLDHEGRVLKALDDAEIERLVAWVRATGVYSVAVVSASRLCQSGPRKNARRAARGRRCPRLAVARGQSREPRSTSGPQRRCSTRPRCRSRWSISSELERRMPIGRRLAGVSFGRRHGPDVDGEAAADGDGDVGPRGRRLGIGQHRAGSSARRGC